MKRKEFTVGKKEFCDWHGKKAENVVFSFLTLGLIAFICLFALGTAKFKQQIIHVFRLPTLLNANCTIKKCFFFF